MFPRTLARGPSETETVTQTITRPLRNAHNLGRDEEDDFRVQTAAQLRRTLESILNSITVMMGGIVGLAIGYGLGAVAASFIPNFPEAHTPWWAVALALGFSALVGVVFGILPAAKAANLDPISSLRYE